MAKLRENRSIRNAFKGPLFALRDRVLQDSEAAMRQAVAAGAAAMDRTLEAATTDTGYYRMLLMTGPPGATAGRHETGLMISKIRTNGLAPQRRGGVTTMQFGWFPGDYQDYFKLQDEGSPPLGGNRRGIPPAHARRAGERVAKAVMDNYFAGLR